MYIPPIVSSGPDGKLMPPLVIKIYGDGTHITIDRLSDTAPPPPHPPSH